ncbi:hypothetical protein [Jejuia pallidilutea]|uniref:hypothetical protein n=1 Tax=Jejuia pallidilutea TaxID=504487 RepID=UPI00126A08CB|nr:hypothetical protein [Jejuia pallidilutea]
MNLLLSKETNTIKKLELFEELVNTASNTDFKIAIVYARLATDLANKTQNKTWQPKFNEMKGRIHATCLN